MSADAADAADATSAPRPTEAAGATGAGRSGLAPGQRRIGSRLDRLSDGQFAVVTSLPGLLLVGLLVLPPILAVLGLSLFRIEFKSDSYTPFVGFRNFAVRLPADTEFLGSLPVTLLFALITTAVAVPLALATAISIHRLRRLRGLLGLLLLMPWAVAPFTDGLFWKMLLDPGSGPINDLLWALHLPRIIPTEAIGSFVAIVLAVTWRAIPLLGILFLGALRQVPADIERAARMDGATAMQTLRRVTLPAIAPAVIAACLVEMILALQTFDAQYALSSDDPPAGSLLAGLAIYHRVIDHLELGYGAAATVVVGLFIALCLAAMYGLVIRPALADRGRRPDDDQATAAPARFDRPDRRPARTWESGPDAPAAAADIRGPSAIRPVTAAVGRVADRAGRVTGALALVAFLAGPIVWTVIASVQTESALHAFPPALSWPPTFDAFSLLWDTQQVRDAAVVSIVVAVGATLIAFAVAVLTAYPLARFALRGSRQVQLALLGSQLVPPIALVIPVLVLVDRLGIRNPIAALIVVNAAFWTPILVWLLRGAFAGVPRSLEQAARIDGSSRLGAILRITLPVAWPAVAAAVAIVFVGVWNDFVFVVVLGGNDTHTLVEVIAQSTTPPIHILAARMVMSAAPCLVLVGLFHRRLLRIA